LTNAENSVCALELSVVGDDNVPLKDPEDKAVTLKDNMLWLNYGQIPDDWWGEDGPT